MKWLPRSLRWVLLVTLLSLLSACQSINLSRFGFPPSVQRDPEPTLTAIESHRFPIRKDTQMVGRPITIISRSGDTLPDIGRHFGLGFNDIAQANSTVDVWTPRPDSQITLPLQFILPESPRKGIVLNLPNMRLFYYLRPVSKTATEVITYPIGIGRQGWSTPIGKARITQKRANPTWTVPASIRREHARDGDPLPRVVKAGPNNPLGQYALRLSMPSYLIHGTNKPYGVGLRISHGCVRLYPENIEPLFNEVSVGTKVRIINQPYLVAWQDNVLYLEAHKPLGSKPKTLRRLKKKLLKKLSKEATKTTIRLDFDKIDRILERSNGIPTPVLQYSRRLDQIIANAETIRHPVRFYGKPDVPPIRAGDWTANAGTFRLKPKAETLAQVLVHQGPSIPSRVRSSAGSYQVILGPFINRKEADKIKKRIHREFDIDVTLIKPSI